jgi:hypothetical protein
MLHSTEKDVEYEIKLVIFPFTIDFYGFYEAQASANDVFNRHFFGEIKKTVYVCPS